jgi:hypothetical protein
MITKIFSLFIFIAGFSCQLLADSPITDTPFSEAYMDVAIVQKAAGTGGVLTPELMDYLADAKQPIDVKMAVINRLGTVYEGKNNANLFFDYLLKKKKYKSEDDLLMNGKTHELIAMAYLAATDNYFDMQWAMTYVYSFQERNENSYTIKLISALIMAQQAMESDWCMVYQLADAVRTNEELDQDMRPAATAIVYEYMDLYGGNCAEGADDSIYEEDIAVPEEYITPLTSTAFADLYGNEPIMARVAEADGILTNELMAFLLSEKQPVDVKMAVINRLGWWVDGNNNGESFLAFALKRGPYKTEAEFLNNARTEDLMCYAYLKGMDSYSDVSLVVPYVDMIRERDPKSYTVNLFSALIVAQMLTNVDYCDVYNTTNSVREDGGLVFDMRIEAAERIFAFMDLYQEACSSEGFEEGGEEEYSGE